MGLDHSGDEHMLSESFIECVITPNTEFLKGADSKDAPFADSHVGGAWPTGIHGDDFRRAVNRDGPHFKILVFFYIDPVVADHLVSNDADHGCRKRHRPAKQLDSHHHAGHRGSGSASKYREHA